MNDRLRDEEAQALRQSLNAGTLWWWVDETDKYIRFRAESVPLFGNSELTLQDRKRRDLLTVMRWGTLLERWTADEGVPSRYFEQPEWPALIKDYMKEVFEAQWAAKESAGESRPGCVP